MSDNQQVADVSLLRFFSFGRAGENRTFEGGNILEVVPMESFTHLDGEIKSDDVDEETAGVDDQDRPTSDSITTNNTLEAEWIDLAGGWRVGAPFVRRGERLLILKYGDADKYYFTTLGMDNHLRKLDTAIFAISANPKEGTNGNIEENCYYFEASSHSNTITIKTTMKNGEKAAYTLQFNLKDGTFLLVDEKGMEFEMNSVKDYFYLKTVKGGELKLEKATLMATLDQWAKIKATDSISLITQQVLIDAPDTTVTGNLQVRGDVDFQKNLAVAGVAKIASLEVTGTSKMSGGFECDTIKCNSINSSGNVIAPNIK